MIKNTNCYYLSVRMHYNMQDGAFPHKSIYNCILNFVVASVVVFLGTISQRVSMFSEFIFIGMTPRRYLYRDTTQVNFIY